MKTLSDLIKIAPHWEPSRRYIVFDTVQCQGMVVPPVVV